MSYLDVTDDEVGDLFQIMYILAAREDEDGNLTITEKELVEVPQPDNISIIIKDVANRYMGDLKIQVQEKK